MNLLFILLLLLYTFRIQQENIPGILKSENTDILGNAFTIHLLTNIYHRIVL